MVYLSFKITVSDIKWFNSRKVHVDCALNYTHSPHACHDTCMHDGIHEVIGSYYLQFKTTDDSLIVRGSTVTPCRLIHHKIRLAEAHTLYFE